VCIAPDFDAAGLKYAMTAAESLYGVAGEVRILHLPDIDEGQDVSDWLNNGGTAEELLRLVDETKPYKPQPERQVRYAILSSVDPREVQYLWPEVLPLGMMTTLVSQEGIGKSTLAAAITAHVTTGTPWPNAPHESNIEGHVLVFSHEEDIARVLVPRLIANGADLERVVAAENIVEIKGGKHVPFTIEHNIPDLELLFDEFPETRLLIFDPITSYTGCKENSNAEVRQALKPLIDLATRRNIAVLALTHLNKKVDAGMINRSIGSRAWSAVPRIIWGIRAEQIEDADSNKTETENRFLLNIKCNIGPKPKGLKFSIGEGGRVTWHLERVMMSMDSDLRVKQSRPEETAEWLQSRLSQGAALSSTIFDEAKERGFSRNSCFQAKKLLNIRVTREGFGSEGQWFWELQDES
jgi:putative DNA primase/helicase